MIYHQFMQYDQHEQITIKEGHLINLTYFVITLVFKDPTSLFFYLFQQMQVSFNLRGTILLN